MLAVWCNLPLWLDSVGTTLSAYICGPLIGIMVGVTGNLIYALDTGDALVYALTSITLALILGFAARKNKMESGFGAMTVSVWAALAALVISVPLNIMFHDGGTGNAWGDGVISRLMAIGSPRTVAVIAGQFYIEFVDKLVTIMSLYLIIKLFRKISKTGPEEDTEKPAETVGKTVGVLAFVLLLAARSDRVSAAEAPSGTVYNNYVQTIFSSENGLPCGEANDIAQTNDGILWIGTYAGLYRYNGSEFHWMDRRDGFDDVRNVNRLYVDAEGRLWIGTNDNGLVISINQSITNVIDTSAGLPTNSVRSIIQSSDGYYYIGTTGSLQVLSLSNGIKMVNTLWEVNYADGITADQSGNVVAVTNNGRLFLMRKGRILSSRQLTDGKEIFRSCSFSPSGKLLAGTSQGRIIIFDISDGSFVEQASLETGSLAYIKDMRYLDNGDMFVTADNGIGYFDNLGIFRIINTNEFSNSVDKMLVDFQGNLWFTSSRLGLLRLAPSSFLNIYSTLGMEHRVINAITFWKNNYYIGTDNGLDVINAELTASVTNSLTRKMNGSRIRCLLVDSRGSLWICTYGSGLIEIEADGTEHVYNAQDELFGNRVRVAIELSDGTILVGSDIGISFIRNHVIDETLTNSTGSINSMILTATELPDGRILVGTDGDGLAILKDHKVSEILTKDDGLSSEVILRTVYDKAGEGVFLITSNGMCYMDRNGDIRKLANFPYYNNYDAYINEEFDTLLVMSSAGIYVADREDVLGDQPDVQYELMNSKSGLDSSLTANSWHYVNDKSELFLPCDSGIYMLNTRFGTPAANRYRMSLASVKLDSADVHPDRNKDYVIPRDTRKIVITPEVVNYSVQIPYVGYYLEGKDEDWKITSLDRLASAEYEKLLPGVYTFHLAVFDSNQQAILAQRSYRFILEKEIQDNGWFTYYLILVPMVAAIWLTTLIVRTRNERVMELQRKELALSQQQVKMSNDTIIAIARAVDAKDERTSQHSWRVSEYAVMIAREYGMDEKDIENLRRAALVHDIGKIGIADAILNKDSRLTDDEYAIMKSHTLRGAEILKDLTFIPHVLDGALFHHERPDGRGYPKGLKGDEIPLFARIIGVADAFDAMTANRVYRKQMDFGYVLNEMEKGRGTQFDPQFTDILLKLINDGTIDLKKLYPAANVPSESPAQQGGAA